MMIKVNSEYLDFDDDIEIEAQIKLFEEISTANGDFSYSFTLPKTQHNLTILGLPFPDTVKTIYNNVPCQLIDDSGFKIYTGSLRVENIVEDIACSFFSGNNEWFNLLTEPLNSLPLYKYNVELTTTNIQASWTKTTGVVFPILDAGALVTRAYPNLKIEDFAPCFYVKTIFKEIFNAQGIKLEGDLFNDDLFNMLTIATNGKSQDDLHDRSCYVKKTTAQNAIFFLTKITFQDESVFPFFDGSTGNFSSSTYTADVKMRVKLDLSLSLDVVSSSIATLLIYVDGTQYRSYRILGTSNNETFSKTLDITLDEGDTVEIYGNSDGIDPFGVVSGTIKITPVYLYYAFGGSSVPEWTQLEFVSNILRIFNALPSYNSDSKTLTINLFNKIQEKTPIDISADVLVKDTDFTEFISNYGKKNKFKYQDSSDEDLREYNISNFVKYGEGIIEVDNDFIDRSADVVESDFTPPITYLNPVFDMSMERINFVELEEINTKNITSVSNSSGIPRFNITNADNLFTVGDLVRIDTGADSDFEYNGDWVVDSVTSTYITVNGASYGSGADGTATLLKHKSTTDDNVHLFVNASNINTLFFSSLSSMLLTGRELLIFESISFSTTSIAFFNLLANGRQINTKFKQGLLFGPVNNPLSYQKTIIDTYWGSFKKILADPVLLRLDGLFSRNKFKALKTFLQPVRIKTNETNNLYYLNRVSNYKSSSETCEAEAIKL